MTKKIYLLVIFLNSNFIKAPPGETGDPLKVLLKPIWAEHPWGYPPMKFRNKLAILTLAGTGAYQCYQYYNYQQQKKRDELHKELAKKRALELKALINGPSDR